MISEQIEELSKRNETRREFTVNVSHELKTYLTSNSGFAELMKNGNIPREVIDNIAEIPKSAHGLGLPMAYRIIKAHGGEFSIWNCGGVNVRMKLR